jgi:hypothetical protein
VAHSVFQQARKNLDAEKIDLAILYACPDFVYSPILKILDNFLDGVPVVGASSLAIISDEGIADSGFMLALLSLPQGAYFNNACIGQLGSRDALEAGEALGAKMLYGFKDIPRNFSIIFADGFIQNSSAFLNGIQERLGRSFPLLGGLASGSPESKETFIYFNQESRTDCGCGLLFGGKINFGFGIKHGWKPLGKGHCVTKSANNIIHEIGGRPAIELYEEYFGKSPEELKKDLRQISLFYPIGIHIEGEDEYLLRNISSIETDGSLVFQSDIPQGSIIKLMIGTKESCLEAARQATEEVKMALPGQKIDLAIVFDSVSRYMLLGRQAIKEWHILRDSLGDETRIIGIYSYGEQAPMGGVGYLGCSYLHNQSIAVIGVAA